jgi:putative heme transporter
VAAVSLRGALPEPTAVWHLLNTADGPWLALAAAAAQVGSMVMFALQQRRLLRAFEVSMPISRAIALTYARTVYCAKTLARPANPLVTGLG